MPEETWNIDHFIFDIVDRCRLLFFPEQWNNFFMSCTKNEIFAMMYLYRHAPASMGEIAEYLGVPLNTVSGVIGRMEKSGFMARMRQETDKRVVTVTLTSEGKAFLEDQLHSLTRVFDTFIQSLSEEERGLMTGLVDKFLSAVGQAGQGKTDAARKASPVRRITIE